jgi:tripartite-type tricarboxylate transporter receptor subunit TctC
MKIRRQILKCAAGAASLALTRLACSSEEAVRIVVPFPAGGGADQVARLLATPLSKRLATPVWIENRPGADGAIAAAHVAHAPPDGKTLLLATYGAISALPHLKSHLAYVPLTDLTPLAHMGQFSMMLFGSAKTGLHHFREFQVHCQSNPKGFNCGTGNVASMVMSAWLGHHWQVDLNQVAYKGEVPAMVDLISDRIQMMFATPTNALGFVREGKLLALAHVARERHRLATEVPSWYELGLQPFAAEAWGGIMGPTGLPTPLMQRYHQAINDCIQKESQMVMDMQLSGFAPQTSSLDQLPHWIHLQSLAWQQAILDSGLQKA